MQRRIASGRQLFKTLQEFERRAPLLEICSGAAIRTSVIAGVGPAVLGTLAVGDAVSSSQLRAWVASLLTSSPSTEEPGRFRDVGRTSDDGRDRRACSRCGPCGTDVR